MFSEIVTLEGHIIDSTRLTELLDGISSAGGRFQILEVHVGRTRRERSHARIELRGESKTQIDKLLDIAQKLGAIWQEPEDAELLPADMDGAFPDDFYSSTNHRTFVRRGGQWMPVAELEMDCGIRFEPTAGAFACVPITKVRKGDLIVCGERGIRTQFEGQPIRAGDGFAFMSSEVSIEKPKNTIIRNAAAELFAVKQAGGKVMLVGGPAIVHTGAVEHVVAMIEMGCLHKLFAGNALAVHDIEHALYDTSLGVHLERAAAIDGGHAHHLRAINTIRRCGGIRAAVEKGVLTEGIMHACVKHGVEFQLAGSIRDDGPLPEVVTDSLIAQDAMRAAIKDVGYVLMAATVLHSVAVGNILPAWVPVLCIDISTAAITKLSDRGTRQTSGLVTDVEPFFRSLVTELRRLRDQAADAKPERRSARKRS